MISYSQLISWRNLCEFLDSQWYKFAELEDIKCHCLPELYNPKVRKHREYLWENYLIQFITWQDHPILSFSNSRLTRRTYKKSWGWRLMKDWEFKIDYLEQIVLFDREPSIKVWEPDLRRRLGERQRQQEVIEFKNKLLSQKESDRRRECVQLGICYRCLNPIPFLMVDCVRCGARQG